MLNQLRQGAKGWVSKLLMGMLVLSFAVWGIGGFEGYGAGTLATVGDAEISVQEFARAYDEAQRAAQQSGRQVNPEQVLQQLLFSAAVDDEAADRNLGISEDRVAAEITETPVFQDASGNFEADRFDALLANARITRDDYVADVRRSLVRAQLAQSVAAGLDVPQPMLEALHRLQNEQRTISYFIVDESAIEPVGAPADSDLQSFFDENQADFRAPEYRRLGILTLDPAAIADPDAVTDEEVAAEYERRKASFTRQERRRFDQIRFESAEAANAALQALGGGKDFDALAQEQGLTLPDLDQGMKTRAEILDPMVADAVFAGAENTPIAVTEGAIEPSIIRVTQIEPGSVTPLEEVAPRLRQEIATRNAHDVLNDLYDQIEDARAGGATLEEVAAELSLPYRLIGGVSREMTAPDGSVITDLPAAPQLISEAFESDVGVENSPIRGEGDVYVFYEVLEVTPDRDRALDEVREEVVAAWTEAEKAERVAARAQALFERLQAGEPLAQVAADIGKPVETAANVTRDASPPGLSRNAVAQAFAGPQGHVANAEGNGGSRILLRVDSVAQPEFSADAADVEAIRTQLASSFTNDVLTTFNRQLLQERETSLNNAAFQQLTGQIQTQ
jgi:peptidyl-prolyl cis-trans isomerase D